MGNYASLSHVQELIPDTLDANSAVTSTTVGEWITEYEALLDAALQDCGYTTPITGATDILILRNIVRQAVAAPVWERMYTDVEIPDKVKRWHEVWTNALQDACAIRLYNQATVVDERGVSYLQIFSNED